MAPDPRCFFPAARFGDVQSVSPISAGLSGAAVYSVTTSRGEFVLRVQTENRSAWANGTAMHRLAADHGIAPPLEHVDDARAGSVSAKVQGIPLGTALAQPAVRPVALVDLVKRLATLHSIPLAASTGPEFTPALAASLWRLQVTRPGFPGWATSLGARLAEASSVVASDPRKVFSHGDLHPANILWDGARVWLLDWERAGLLHPYSDLATLSNFTNLPDDAALALLEAQERTVIGEKEQRIFLAARERSRIVYGAVFLSLVPDLTRFPLASREESPTLAQCFQRVAAGTLAPNTAEGQALIGAALFKQTGS
jgi:aminoglycoside phosphotransferase (APT) family kinase protein